MAGRIAWDNNELVGAGRGRQEHALVDATHDLLEAQRPVVGRRRQAEAVLDQRLLAGAVALVLAVELGHGEVGLVHDHEEVVGEVVEQRVRRRTRLPPVERGRVVLDAVAVADLGQHLEVVLGAHAQALGLEQLALCLEAGQLDLQLVLDAPDGVAHPLVIRHVVGGRVHDQLVELGHLLAGEGVDHHDGLDLVAEQLDSHGRLVVGGVDLDGVAPDPELAPHQVHVVALVAHVDQAAQHGPLVVLLADAHHQHLVAVLLGRAQAVDARHRGDHDHVAAGQQGRGGGVAQPVDLVVDRRVLLDVGVGGRHVGLGLVVVVVADEVLDPVVGEQLAELVGQLGGQRLVGGDDQRRLLHPLDGPGHGGALARAGDAQQRLEAVAPLDAGGQLLDGLGLVAGGLPIGHDT